jgi:hypothetical protein
MTLPQFYDLCAYWADHPPVHELVAGYLGYKRKETAPSANLGALLALAPGGVLKAAALREAGDP